MSKSFFATHPLAWSQLTPEAARPAIEEALRLAEERVAALESLPLEQANYATVLAALENSSEELGRAWGLVQHLDSVCNSEAMREVINEWLPQVTAFYDGLPLREELWKRIERVHQQLGSEELSSQQQRHLKETFTDFVQAGAQLQPEAKQELEKINEELAQLTQKFSENVLDATNAWELFIEDEAELAGLPEQAKQEAAQSAAAKDRPDAWRLTLQAPSLMAVLRHAQSAELRETLWRASAAVGREGDFDNRPLIGQILKLRQRKAEILGEENFADMVLQRRMAGSGQKAIDFTEDLCAKVIEQARKEHAQLSRRAAEGEGKPADTLLNPWDGAYYAEKLRQEECDFDGEALRPYLPLDSVMNGMFALCEELFGIQVQELPSEFAAEGETLSEGKIEVWHEDVQAYALQDASSGKQLGIFFADWYPRESKRGGAWMNPMQTLQPFAEQNAQPHVGCICGNMSKPVGDGPALMLHDEVETIFHEFGHLLHHLLGKAEVRSLSGTSVPWDFVELPSQIMENWCWEREALDRFARHHETGEAIPEDLFQALKKTRTFRMGSFFLTQLYYGRLDLDMHAQAALWTEAEDLDALTRERLADYLLPTSVPAQSLAPRFSHLFSSPTGYAAGYYSYKWSEVLDADAFTRFQQEGIANPATGMAFREEILSTGNTRPVEESFRAFLGRDPSPKALLERSGLG